MLDKPMSYVILSCTFARLPVPAGCTYMLVGGLTLTGLEKWRDVRASICASIWRTDMHACVSGSMKAL